MRKSVLFLILVIYLISVVVVTFFGMKARMDQFQIYMNRIEITSFDQKVGDDKYLIVKYNETEGYTSLFIEYEYGPTEATFPEKIKFTLSNNTYVDDDGNTQYYATISQMGELTFFKKKAVKVTLTTTDGSKLSDTVTVICR